MCRTSERTTPQKICYEIHSPQKPLPVHAFDPYHVCRTGFVWSHWTHTEALVCAERTRRKALALLEFSMNFSSRWIESHSAARKRPVAPCVQPFLKRSSDEKCSCVRLGPEHAFLKSWYHFYGVQVWAHPTLLHRKEWNSTIIYFMSRRYFAPTDSLRCFANGSILLFVVAHISRCFQAIASYFSPLQWRPCVSAQWLSF